MIKVFFDCSTISTLVKELDNNPRHRDSCAIKRLKLLVNGVYKKRAVRRRGETVETYFDDSPDAIRRCFTSFLKESWKRIPFVIDVCNPLSIRASNRHISYHDIVVQVAQVIHREMFSGVISIPYGDPGYDDYVELPSVECK